MSLWLAAVSGDWNSANWTGPVPNGTADTGDIEAAGAYTVSIAALESFTVQTLIQAAGTLSVSGTLTLNGGNNDVFARTTINAGGAVVGTGTAASTFNKLQNLGLFEALNGNLLFQNGTFDNQGTVAAVNGIVFIAATSMPFQTGTGTLTAGSYLSSGNPSAVELYAFTGTAAVIENDATITLDGLGSRLLGRDSNTNSFVSLDASLQTIGATGMLTLSSSRDFAAANILTDKGRLVLGGGTLSDTATSGSIAVTSTGTLSGNGFITTAVVNTGLLESSAGPTNGGTLALSGGYSGAGAISIDPYSTLVLPSGNIGVTVVDNGTLRVNTGTLTLSGGATGSGNLLINSGAGIDLTGRSVLNAVFYGGAATLKLENPDVFTGNLIGFETTDTLDLAGIAFTNGASTTSATTSVDGKTLIVTTAAGGTLTFGLNTSYAGKTFAVTGDGSTGSDISVVGVNYAFEGPQWNNKTITWSFATSNLAGDASGPQYSSFMTAPGDAPYMGEVTKALSAWANLTGIQFVQATDGSAVDLRIGWGDFSGGSGEIGEAGYAYNPGTGLFDPDVIVRLQDPKVTGNALNFDGTNYIYQGTVTSLTQVIIHEIGHALGLDHSTDTSAIMWNTATPTNRVLDVSDIAGITSLFAATACYAAGTRILTASGEVSVETLRDGDLLPGLVSGQMRRVRWIGHRSVKPDSHPRPHDLRPIRVRAHAFAPCTPVRDLLLSPDHAVYAEGVLIPVRYLLNGLTIAQEPAAEITYFHIELEDLAGNLTHDVVLAEGLPAESYLDTGNRGAFINADGPVMTHPDFALRTWDAEGCAPLHTSGTTVARIRQALHDRANALGHELASRPDLHLLSAGRRIDGTFDGATWRVRHPGGPVTLASTAAVPAETDLTSIDARRLGVAVAAITLDGTALKLTDRRLGQGWHAPEPGLRWTDGHARLTLPAGLLEITIAAAPKSWRLAA